MAFSNLFSRWAALFMLYLEQALSPSDAVSLGTRQMTLFLLSLLLQTKALLGACTHISTAADLIHP